MVEDTTRLNPSGSRSPGDFDLFPMLPVPLRETFLAAGTSRRYASGQVIYAQGDLGREMYRIVSGFVRLSFVRYDGREYVYSFFGPTDCFGYSSLIDGKGLPHTAEAHTEVEVKVVSQKAFTSFRAHRSFDNALLVHLCRHMRLLSEYAVDAALDDLPERLKLRLIELARKDGPGGLRVQLPQSELALMLGTSRQSINKLLKQFQKDGLIELAYGSVLLRGLEAQATPDRRREKSN